MEEKEINQISSGRAWNIVHKYNNITVPIFLVLYFLTVYLANVIPFIASCVLLTVIYYQGYKLTNRERTRFIQNKHLQELTDIDFRRKAKDIVNKTILDRICNLITVVLLSIPVFCMLPDLDFPFIVRMSLAVLAVIINIVYYRWYFYKVRKQQDKIKLEYMENIK